MKNTISPYEQYKTHCFSEEKLSNHIFSALKGYKPRSIIYKKMRYREAAVLIPLFFKDGQAHILFTKRTEHLEHHKGQISFPGGRRDDDDPDLITTALRETREELGISEEDVKVFGPTDRFLTPSKFFVHPYVGIFPYPYELTISKGEIDRIIEVPLYHLLKDENFMIKPWQRQGETFNVHYYQYQQDTIWGVTGFLLSNFLSTVFGVNRDVWK